MTFVKTLQCLYFNKHCIITPERLCFFQFCTKADRYKPYRIIDRQTDISENITFLQIHLNILSRFQNQNQRQENEEISTSQC